MLTYRAVYAALRYRCGFASAARATDIRITRAWTNYTALVQLPAWAVLLLFLGGIR